MSFLHKVRSAKFSDRKDVSFDEIYSENFQALGVPRDLAHELWSEAAKTLRISPSKLRASDRFDSELKYHLPWFPIVDLNDDFYWAAVVRLKRLHADNARFENAKTLGEYISTFAKLEMAAR